MTRSDELAEQALSRNFDYKKQLVYAVLALREAIKELPAQIVEQIKNLDEEEDWGYSFKSPCSCEEENKTVSRDGAHPQQEPGCDY